MGTGLSEIKHVKLPVSDLRRSTAWYRRVFDLELVTEYFEQGDVRGVQLADRDGSFEIALRQRDFCAGHPTLSGFDVFALRAPSRELVTQMAERCDRLGVSHEDVWDYPGYAAGLDIPDPDGIPVRVVWHDPHGGFSTGFIGIETDDQGQPSTYEQPRLSSVDPKA